MAKVISDNEWIDFLSEINPPRKSTTFTTIKVVKSNKPIDDSIISISIPQLHEFYGNLILNGFSVSEALEITAKVASNALRAK